MDVVLLCAGYATRLYPITENFPKPLLNIANRPIIDHLVDDLSKNESIHRFFVVSNHKYLRHFTEWARTRKESITVLDDGSTANENRLGAVKDILFAIENGKITDDVFVLAGDNLLDFSFSPFIAFFHQKKASCIMTHVEDDIEKLKRTGVIEMNDHQQIVRMEEKPRVPKSHFAVPPFYIFSKTVLSKIREGIEAGCKVDAPGDFLEWLCQEVPVYAFIMPGKRFDIGTIEDYLLMKDLTGLV
jgi:glucose-1-phosphate thymidylyltransferase